MPGHTGEVMSSVPPMFPGGLRIGAEERAAVDAVLADQHPFRYYGGRPAPSRVAAFEHDFAQRVGVRHAVAVASGTSALAAGLAALGIGPGDQVLVPAYTWISTPAAVLSVGAVPVIVDIDASLSIDVEDARGQLTARTKAIIAVHMRGAPADMEAVLGFARRHGLSVLEDVAQSLGGSYQGQPLGSLGDIGIFSLQFNKVITSGEGGVVVTNDRELYRRALQYHDVAAFQRLGIAEEAPFVATTCRMTELQGALAQVQLGRLDGIIEDCRRNFDALLEELGGLPGLGDVELRPSNDVAGELGIALVLQFPNETRAGRFADRVNEAGGVVARLHQDDRIDYHVAPYWTPILERRSWSEVSPWSLQDGLPDYGPSRWRTAVGVLGRSVQVHVSPDLTPPQITGMAERIRAALQAA